MHNRQSICGKRYRVKVGRSQNSANRRRITTACSDHDMNKVPKINLEQHAAHPERYIAIALITKNYSYLIPHLASFIRDLLSFLLPGKH